MSMGMRFMPSGNLSRLFLISIIPLGICVTLCDLLLQTVKRLARCGPADDDITHLPAALHGGQQSDDDDDYEFESFSFGSDAAATVSPSSLEAIRASLPASVLLKSLLYQDDDDGRPFTCAVCLSCIAEEEEIRRLPQCTHLFHTSCIDSWVLWKQPTCPLCRASLPIAASNPILSSANPEATP